MNMSVRGGRFGRLFDYHFGGNARTVASGASTSPAPKSNGMKFSVQEGDVSEATLISDGKPKH